VRQSQDRRARIEDSFTAFRMEMELRVRLDSWEVLENRPVVERVALSWCFPHIFAEEN
jgi:hypothetical protein